MKVLYFNIYFKVKIEHNKIKSYVRYHCRSLFTKKIYGVNILDQHVSFTSPLLPHKSLQNTNSKRLNYFDNYKYFVKRIFQVNWRCKNFSITVFQFLGFWIYTNANLSHSYVLNFIGSSTITCHGLLFFQMKRKCLTCKMFFQVPISHIVKR